MPIIDSVERTLADRERIEELEAEVARHQPHTTTDKYTIENYLNFDGKRWVLLDHVNRRAKQEGEKLTKYEAELNAAAYMENRRTDEIKSLHYAFQHHYIQTDNPDNRFCKRCGLYITNDVHKKAVTLEDNNE